MHLREKAPWVFGLPRCAPREIESNHEEKR